jgi:vacuolar-type H+-ATPase subunit I/STV1
MKFAKIVFWIAGIWGVLVLTPLFFIFNMIGRQDPPPITHPAFYYGFVGTALAWQFAFMIIATDPVRFRPIMIAGIFEKFSYAVALAALYLQGRLHASDLTFAGVDLVLGVLFVAAFVRTGTKPLPS